jgi:hypothetical protein
MWIPRFADILIVSKNAQNLNLRPLSENMSKGPEDVHIDDGEDGGNGDDNSALCEGIDENACLFQSVAKLGLLQTHINFPRFLPIFPDFLKRLSHLAPISPYHPRPPNAQVPSQSRPTRLMGNMCIAVRLMPASCWPHRSHMARSLPHVRLMSDTCTQPRLTFPSW